MFKRMVSYSRSFSLKERIASHFPLDPYRMMVLDALNGGGVLLVRGEDCFTWNIEP
jgi:hypothetical protein